MLTSGCSPTHIGKILNNFDEYEGKEVTISGTVGETIWLAVPERGAYQVGDGSGTIWVTAGQPPPQHGEKVRVTGTAHAAFTIGDREPGKVITEEKRSWHSGI